jgi:hypothetical protein
VIVAEDGEEALEEWKKVRLEDKSGFPRPDVR